MESVRALVHFFQHELSAGAAARPSVSDGGSRDAENREALASILG